MLDPPHRDIRYRHVAKGGDHYYLVANAGLAPAKLTATTPVAGAISVIDPFAGTEIPLSTLTDLTLPPQTTLIIRVAS